MEMKEEALKLADELEGYYWGDGDEELTPSMLIRRLVEELDRLDYDLKSLAKRYKALDRTKPLSDEEIDIIKYAVCSAICSLESEINEQEKTFKGYEHCSNLSGLREELNDCLKAKDILERHGIK